MDDDNIAREYVQNILDVFTGADGGMAFVKLRHVYLPAMIKDRDQFSDMLVAIEKLNKLCGKLLNPGECNEI